MSEIPSSISCPYDMRRLAGISEAEARELARKSFNEVLGHISVDVPIATDAKGEAQFSRYRLKDFLVAIKQQPAPEGE